MKLLYNLGVLLDKCNSVALSWNHEENESGKIDRIWEETAPIKFEGIDTRVFVGLFEANFRLRNNRASSERREALQQDDDLSGNRDVEAHGKCEGDFLSKQYLALRAFGGSSPSLGVRFLRRYSRSSNQRVA